MPLDLQDAEAENTELLEYKAKVKAIAKEYAERHGWCEVVDEALEEIGIDSDTGIKAEIEVQVSVTLPVTLSTISDLVGKTTEEQNAIIAEKMAKDSLMLLPSRQNNGVNYLSTHDVLKPEQVKVVDINQVEQFQGSNGLPFGYKYGFTGSEGRVRHIVLIEGNRYTGALCGTGAMYGWEDHSPRDEGRTCARCQASANRMMR